MTRLLINIPKCAGGWRAIGASKLTWWDAVEIIGVSDRTMRRWRERLETDGYSGLGDGRAKLAKDTSGCS